MKPTLEEIKDNYERVLLQLENGNLAGIKRVRSEDYYVVEQQDWNFHVVAIELANGYKRESRFGYNIDRIKFLSDRNEVDNFLQYEECEIDWDWNINNPQCDDRMDAYEYAIQKLGLNNNPHNRDYIIKGENNNMMNEILEIYEEREHKKINEKYDELENSIKLTDARYKVWKECVDTLEKLYIEDKVVTKPFASIALADETMKKLSSMFDDRKKELDELYSKKAEVNAQLSMCETYDQKQEILRRYNIINKNGKVNG